MKKRSMIVVCLSLILIISLSAVSAFSFSGFWKKITGQVTASTCVKGSADLNFDGNVDKRDNIILASFFGSDCGYTNRFCDCADINQDGKVYTDDFIIFVDQMGCSGDYVMDSNGYCIKTCKSVGGDGCTTAPVPFSNSIFYPAGDDYCSSTYEGLHCVGCEAGYYWDGSNCDIKTCESVGGNGCTTNPIPPHATFVPEGDTYCSLATDYLSCIACESGYNYDGSGNCVKQTCADAGGDGCTYSIGTGEKEVTPGQSYSCVGSALFCVSCNQGYAWDGNNCVQQTCADAGGDVCGYYFPNAYKISGSCDRGGCYKCNSGYTWDGSKCILASCNTDVGCKGFISNSKIVNGTCEGSGLACRECNQNYTWDGSKCILASCNTDVGCKGFISNSKIVNGTCEGSGLACRECNQGYTWDGSACKEIVNQTINGTGNGGGGDRGTSTKSCGSKGYWCRSEISCQNAGGNILNYSCSGSLVCCDSEKVEQTTCEEMNGVVCDTSSEIICDGGVWSNKAIDLGYEEVCCVGGTCKQLSYISECEQNLGRCKTSCDKGEKRSSYDCEEGAVCCVEKIIPEQRDGYWKIFSLVFLILFVSAIIVIVLIKRKSNK